MMTCRSVQIGARLLMVAVIRSGSLLIKNPPKARTRLDMGAPRSVLSNASMTRIAPFIMNVGKRKSMMTPC